MVPLALQGLSPVFVDTCFLLDTPLSFPVPVPAEIGPGMESGVHLLLGPTLYYLSGESPEGRVGRGQ